MAHEGMGMKNVYFLNGPSFANFTPKLLLENFKRDHENSQDWQYCMIILAIYLNLKKYLCPAEAISGCSSCVVISEHCITEITLE